MNKKKILIVYELAGMGHYRMTKIIKEIMGKYTDVEIIEITMCDIIKSKPAEFLVKLWNILISKNFIRTADILLNFGTRLIFNPFATLGLTSVVHKKLEEINPDILISTYSFINKELASYANEKGMPFHVFILEMAAYMDFAVPNANHVCYFEETRNIIRSFDLTTAYYSIVLNRKTNILEKVKYVLCFYKDYLLKAYKNPAYKNPVSAVKEINNVKCSTIGPLSEKKYYENKDTTALKRKYGIPEGIETVMLASGSIGGKLLLNMLNAIIKACDKRLNILVMCGNDNATYKTVKSMQYSKEHLNIFPFSYTKDFDELMQMSDCLVARPSAGIFIDSLLKRVPVIAMEPVPSNDRGSITMIRKYQIGEVCKKGRDLWITIAEILENKKSYLDNMNNLLKEYPNTLQEQEHILHGLLLDKSQQHEAV